MNAETEVKWSPPYASFQTLLNTMSRMAQEGGVPSQIDRSYLSNMPGSVRATFLGSMRSLSLIDDDAKPTDRLISLVEADESDELKKELIADLVSTHYQRAMDLPPMATQAQLETVFRDYGVSGSTLRKAIAFYLAAARFAGLSLSPHFRVPKDTPSGEARLRSRRTASKPVTTSPAATTPPVAGAARHPLIDGLIRELPTPGDPFPLDRQEAWFAIAKATFTLLYPTSDAQSASRRSGVSETGGDSH